MSITMLYYTFYDITGLLRGLSGSAVGHRSIAHGFKP